MVMRFIPAAVCLLVSVSAFSQNTAKTQNTVKDPAVMVGHKGNSFGEKIPEWVSMEEPAIEESAAHSVPSFTEFKNKLLFRIEIEAPTMKESRTRIDSADMTKIIPMKLAERVKGKYPFKDNDDTFCAEFYDAINDIKPGEVRVEDRWWIRFRSSADKTENIRYYLLCSVSKDKIITELRAVLKEIDADSNDDKEMKNAVNAWINSGLPDLPAIPAAMRKIEPR